MYENDSKNCFESLQTSLHSLGLKSMKQVNFGAIVIKQNKHLCFVIEIDWDKIKKSKDHDTITTLNRNVNDCSE